MKKSELWWTAGQTAENLNIVKVATAIIRLGIDAGDRQRLRGCITGWAFQLKHAWIVFGGQKLHCMEDCCAVASLRAQPWGSALISVGIGTNNSMSLISRWHPALFFLNGPELWWTIVLLMDNGFGFSLVLRRAFLNPAPEKVSNQNASVPAAARVLSLIAACDTRVKQLSSSSCYSLSWHHCYWTCWKNS